MAFTLKIRTTGLWVYVPKKSVEQGRKDNEIRMLAVDTVSMPPKDQHEPILLVEEKYRQDDTWRGGQEPESGLNLYPLEERHLEVAGAAGNALEIALVDAVAPETDPCPRDAAQEEDFRWLPRMWDFHHRDGRVEPDNLNRHPVHRADVTAGVRLSQGRFRTHFVSRDCEGEILVWRSGLVKQAFADQMELTATIHGTSVQLTAVDGVGNEDTVTLKPDAGEVVVYLKNLPKSSKRRLLLKPHLQDPDQGMPHFPQLGKLFENQPQLSSPRAQETCRSCEEPEPFEPCAEFEDRRKLNAPQCPGLAGDP